MKTKTAYRAKPHQAEIPQPDRPATIEPQPESELKAEAIIQAEPKSDAPAEPEESEATRRLKQQLADLEYSAKLNHQAAQMPQVPLTREQKLDLWRQKGMPEDQAEFLKANPEMIDYSDLAAFAANEAVQAGHERGSYEHMQATKDLFDRHMEHLKQQAAANGAHAGTAGAAGSNSSATPGKVSAIRERAGLKRIAGQLSSGI